MTQGTVVFLWSVSLALLILAVVVLLVQIATIRAELRSLEREHQDLRSRYYDGMEQVGIGFRAAGLEWVPGSHGRWEKKLKP